MAQHLINISVLNNSVGVPQSTDGIMMMFMRGVAVASTLNLDQAYLLTQLSDAAALGINAAYDVTNETAVYQQISEFYTTAGDGSLLWIVVTAKANAYATYVASATFAALVKSTAAATPANRAKMLGLCYDVPQALQQATDFPADVLATIPALQTVQQQLFQLGYQFSAIVDGYNMSSTVTPATIGTMATMASSSVSLCITSTLGNGVSQVGMALGRFARIGIGHGFGAVEDGPVAESTAFLTNSILVPSTGALVVGNVYTVYGGAITYNAVLLPVGTIFTAVMGHTVYTTAAGGYVIDNATPIKPLTINNTVVLPGLTDAYINQLGQKQFLFVRTWFNHSGFYWNDGATCTDPTLQLATQEYNRVANAMAADALSLFIDEMGKNLPLDVNTGNVDPGYLNAKQAQFYNEFISPLTVAGGSGDITDGSITITGVNFNSTKTLNFVIEIVPTPILGNVTGEIEFTSTL